MSNEKMKAVMKDVYTKIGDVIGPQCAGGLGSEVLPRIIGTQAGLCLAQDGNLYALKETGLISAEAHDELSELNKQLTLRLQTALMQGFAEVAKRHADADERVVH